MYGECLMGIEPEIAQGQTHEQSESPVFGYLKKLPLLSNLSEKEISYFEKASQIRSYKKGKIIFLQGDTPTFFYIIGDGWVKLFRTMPEGEEIIIDMLTAGNIFGESAIFERDVHMYSAQVVEDVELLSIPSHVLKEQTVNNPRLALNMLAVMSRHHRHHTNALAFNTMLSAPQRIGCFLLRTCSESSQKSVKFRLPYDKTLIADTLGMKGATFSRALNVLRLKTSIRIEGDFVEIDSVKKLAKYVYGPTGTKYVSGDM